VTAVSVPITTFAPQAISRAANDGSSVAAASVWHAASAITGGIRPGGTASVTN